MVEGDGWKGWERKVVLVTGGISPVLSSLRNIQPGKELGDELDSVIPYIKQLEHMDGFVEFNRAVVHGFLFGAWVEVKTLLQDDIDTFAIFSQHTISTRIYGTLLEKCDLAQHFMDCMACLPVSPTEKSNLFTALFTECPQLLAMPCITPFIIQHGMSLHNRDDQESVRNQTQVVLNWLRAVEKSKPRLSSHPVNLVVCVCTLSKVLQQCLDVKDEGKSKDGVLAVNTEVILDAVGCLQCILQEYNVNELFRKWDWIALPGLEAVLQSIDQLTSEEDLCNMTEALSSLKAAIMCVVKTCGVSQECVETCSLGQDNRQSVCQELENVYGSRASHVPSIDRLLEAECGEKQCLGADASLVEPLAAPVPGLINSPSAGGWHSGEAQSLDTTLVHRMLGMCSAWLTPGHACYQVSPHLRLAGSHSAVALARLLLDLLNGAMDSSDVLADAALHRMIPVFIQVVQQVGNLDQQECMLRYARVCDNVRKLHSLSGCIKWTQFCTYALTSLCNRLKDLKVVEDGVILDKADALVRQGKVSSQFLPFVILFPEVTAKALIQDAIVNRAQLGLVCDLLKQWETVLGCVHNNMPLLVSVILEIIQTKPVLVSTTAGSRAFVALIEILTGKGTNVGHFSVSVEDVLQHIILNTLESCVAEGNTVIVDLLLKLAVDLLGLEPVDSENACVNENTSMDKMPYGWKGLLVLACKVLAMRPCSTAWDQPMPAIVPMGCIALCETITEQLMSKIERSRDAGGSIVVQGLDECMAQVSCLSWDARIRFSAVLETSTGGKVDQFFLPPSFSMVYGMDGVENACGNDPYVAVEVVKDLLVFLSVSDGHCDAFKACMNHDSVVKESKCVEEQLARQFILCMSQTSPAVFAWCSVVALAHKIAFLTISETHRLFSKGLPLLESCLVNHSQQHSDDVLPDELTTLSQKASGACFVIELACRAVHLLGAHEDVGVHDRQQAVSSSFVHLIEGCNCLMESVSGDVCAAELIAGRGFREVCGLVASLQGYYECMELQGLLLHLLQIMTDGCQGKEDNEGGGTVLCTALGVPLRLAVEWWCQLMVNIANPMRDVLILALDRMVDNKKQALVIASKNEPGILYEV